jgi:hypothetical protein
MGTEKIRNDRKAMTDWKEREKRGKREKERERWKE